jgi:hypothetical protein
MKGPPRGPVAARPDQPPPYASYAARSAARVRDAIGAARFERAFAEGASCTVEQAVALALSEDRGPGDRTAAARRQHTDRSGGLTRRELEIAGLLAEGLTDRGDRHPARDLSAHRRATRRSRPHQARHDLPGIGRQLGRRAAGSMTDLT